MLPANDTSHGLTKGVKIDHGQLHDGYACMYISPRNDQHATTTWHGMVQLHDVLQHDQCKGWLLFITCDYCWKNIFGLSNRITKKVPTPNALACLPEKGGWNPPLCGV